VMSAQPRRDSEGSESWVLDVLRRLDVANASLDRAKEVEDYQAVGMRLREALVSLGEQLAAQVVDDGTERPKRADFKGWAAIGAGALAPGGGSEHLRGLLKATSEKTWAYVSWLTHARHATELDARLALDATTQVVDAFIMATTRCRVGAPERCPACGSPRLTIDYSDEGLFRLCKTCGWESPAEALELTAVHEEADGSDCPLSSEGWTTDSARSSTDGSIPSARSA